MQKKEQRVFLESAENEGRFVSSCCWQWPDDIWGFGCGRWNDFVGNRNGYVDDHVNPSVRISRWFDRHRTDVSSVYYLRTMFFAVSKNVYEYSMRIWKNHSSFSGQVSTYIVKMLICAVVLCAGILSEVYCNPVIMKILIQNLKIF